MTVEPQEFDLCGPLPSGVTVLEASAGTGKTYTIAALAARYVADGLPLEKLLLITFTRAATGELRDRVRERLSRTELELSEIMRSGEDPGTDRVLSLLATGTPQEVEQRRDRLARAVADFDAATIATTHAFCETVLAELGTVGDLETGAAFVADVSDLIDEALDDFYVRKFIDAPRVLFTREQALTIARAAISHPMAALEPRDAARESTAATRFRLADRIRDEIERRKRRLALMTYDDLLTRLRDALDGPNKEAARERLRDRFSVVLVDEFQDTDPIQWQILHRAFAVGDTTLVLIADPKQAIYSFRGADVFAYLQAAKTAQTHSTLRVNQRSDQPLLDAYDALFGNARLGHEEIVYRQVSADEAHGTSRLVGAPHDAALRIRIAPRTKISARLAYDKYAPAAAAREYVSVDLAADIVELLASPARIETRDAAGRAIGSAPLRPGDIAVLVRANRQAELVRDELRAAQVPAVINGAGSVFASDAASDWLRLLDALERPASTLRAKTAANTEFFGWSAARIAAASEADWEDVHRRLHGWSRILRERGVAAMTETIMIAEGLPGRMLGFGGGERELTDIRHLAQLLHEAASAERLGVTALRGWLAERVHDTWREEGEEAAVRRLESDEQAVQVLTIHRSKGLEFPIVYCPFLWNVWLSRDRAPVLFHDDGARLRLDVGMEGRSFDQHAARSVAEQRGEDLRLAYVALTRARHQAVIWWVGATDSHHSPLSRLVFDRDGSGNVPSNGSSVPDDRSAWRRFKEVADRTAGQISLEAALERDRRAWQSPAWSPGELAAATFSRELDLRWRRTSYSDITADAHDPIVASEPEQGVLSDEPEQATPAPEAEDADAGGLERSSPLGAMPVGVEFGTFVHRVLQATDFAAPDLDAELSRTVAAVAARGGLGAADAADAVLGLRAAIETPLGPLVADRRLRELTRGDRLDELDFELPLAGGDDPTGRMTLDAIAVALRTHLPAGDQMRAYADRLEDPALRSTVRGFLTGSIDLVLRVEGPRFAIVDYKTNWLGPFDEELTLRYYRPSAVAAEMARAQYGLQALLYTVALHRYLRWRLRGYDPDSHLAGVLYLFLRGMAGAEQPRVDGVPCGVFAWRPPGALIAALSEVLDGR